MAVFAFLTLALLGTALAAGGGGSCTTDADCRGGGYCSNGQCVCSEYFDGAYCQWPWCDAHVDPRYPRVEGEMPHFIVCNLAGRCMSDFNGEFSCRCNNSGLLIEGEFCDQVAPCTTSDDCNGQTCGVDGRCQCEKGFDGPTCGENSCAGLTAPGFSDVSPYCHTNGECIPSSDKTVNWMCSCRTGFSGMTCEDSSFRCTPGEDEEDYWAADGVPCKFNSKCNVRGDGCVCDENMFFADGVDCGRNYCNIVVDQNNGELVQECNNRGHCQPHTFQGLDYPVYSCECTSDLNYAGAACQYHSCVADASACVHGECSTETGVAECICGENWLGRECNLCRADYVIVDGQCVHPDCVYDGVVCSGGDGVCTVDPATGRGQCQCLGGSQPIGTNQCVPETCLISNTVCSNHGRCLSIFMGYSMCACLVGYTGDFCETPVCGGIEDTRYIPNPVGNLMRVVNCHAGGECVRAVVDGTASWRCECRPGFSGSTCENFSCENSEQCNYHGHCMINPGHGNVCQCDTGFDGRDCGVNACGVYTDSIVTGTVYCNNGGQCNGAPNNEGGLGVYCACSYGFSGETCETFVCSNRPAACQGGSTCARDYYNNEYCKNCPEYMSGRNCAVDHCGAYQSEYGPCNGNGVCTRTISGWFCLCDKGYVGVTCEYEECTVEGETPMPNAMVCQNGAVCKPRRRDEGSNYCGCDGLYGGLDCSTCAPGTEEIPDFDVPGRMICTHHTCLDGLDICSGHGTCKRLLEGFDTFRCECDEGFVRGITNNICIHENCQHVYGEDTVVYCGMGGSCTQDAAGVWGCHCNDQGFRLSKEGLCFAERCYTSTSTNVICNGHGVCLLDPLERDYVCVCFSGYGLKGDSKSMCVSTGAGKLSSGAVAGIVVVVIVCVLAVVGVLVWYFISKKRLVSKYAKLQSEKVTLAEQTQSSI